MTAETPKERERREQAHPRDQAQDGNHQPEVIHGPILIEYGKLRIAGSEEMRDSGGIMKADTLAHVAALFSAVSGAMVAILAASLLLSGVSSSTLRNRTGAPGGVPDLIRHLEDTVPTLKQRYDVPGVAVLLVRSGEVVWRKSFGHACRESGEALAGNHLLMTHSISKSVTARGIVQLAREGAIDLDTPVREYLGPVPYGEVTVRQLLSNSSGLPLGPIGLHYPPGSAVPETAAYLADLSGSAVSPRHTPGEQFEYSNTGFAVLELVVQEAAGLSFADYMRDTVLRPLGMKDSAFVREPDLAGRVPFGYDLRGAPVAPYLYPSQAPGGLFATLEDLGRFLAESVIDPIEELYEPNVAISGIFRAVADSYGLGHFLETLPGGERAVFHGGQGLGWMTHFHILPDRGEGIVIITNSQRSWPLIAILLRDWSVWTGAGPVGMSRILLATRILGVVIVLLALAGVALGVRGLRGLRRIPGMPRLPAARRSLDTRTSPAAPEQPGLHSRSGVTSAAELLGAGAIALLLLWALRQDYLFVSSVFPTLARPLGMALTGLAAGLTLDAVVSAVTPPRKSTRHPENYTTP
ncbi:MAG: class A beta-lactamase-related serine hydrolase [Spirochaetaceae bacterium]|nr:MAG: class A beta-lactamase-related serine hydrolase [Spirochaetaceae bacterium]